MTLALFELADNPETHKKAREEVIKVLADYDGKFTYDSFFEMVN